MESSCTEDSVLLHTALSEVKNLLSLLSNLPESHRETVLQELKLGISNCNGGTDLSGNAAGGAKEFDTESTSLAVDKTPELSSRKTQHQCQDSGQGNGSVEAPPKRAATVRPCFLKLVPLSRSQIETTAPPVPTPARTPVRQSSRNRRTRLWEQDETEEDEENIDDPNFSIEDLFDSDDDVLDNKEDVKSPRRKPGEQKSGRRGKGNNTFICEKCGKSFSQKSGLDVHLKRHNGIKSFACAFCDYNAVCKIEILRHMSRHTGERNYPCTYCRKLFTTDSSLRNHVKHIHLRLEKLSCEQCRFQTHSRDILRRHKLIKHSSQELFECPVCHEVVKQKGSFVVHMRKHTGERPYHCSLCPKAFKSNSQLAAHSRTHRPGQHPCPQCGRNFSTLHHLNRHKLVHSGEKPYTCHKCTYACNVKSNLTKHIRTVHKIHSFSFKEPYRTSTGPDDNPEALERGRKVADQYLKEHTQRAGEILTLDDLKRQSLEQKEKQQEAKLQELRSERNTSTSNDDVDLPLKQDEFIAQQVGLVPAEDPCHPDNSQQQAGNEFTSCPADTLTNTVHLLDSAVRDACMNESDGQYGSVSETVSVPIEIGSNMFIIQLTSEQNIILQ